MARTPLSARSPGGEGLLSPLIHGRVRLLIVSHLIRAGRPVSFTDLRRELQLTDGTLSVHLSRLEKGGIVTLQKRFVKKRPQTLIDLTRVGLKQFRQYVAELRRIVPGLE